MQILSRIIFKTGAVAMKQVIHTFKIAFMASMLGLVFAPNGFADCKYLAEGLKYKMDEYRAFRNKNEVNLKELLASEAKCKDDGARVSAFVAKTTEGQSCQVQADMTAMNKEMKDIGEKCSVTFSKLHELQNLFKLRFNGAKADLDEGMDYMDKSKILQKYCGKEIEVTKTMVTAFVKLETEIVLVKTRSLAGEQDYGKFKDAAKQLEALTAANNRNCSNAESVSAGGPAAVSKTYGKGSGEAVKGKSPKSSSDISGTQKAIDDEKRADSVIRALPAEKK